MVALCVGKTSAEVSEALRITFNSVKKITCRIYKKLHVRNRTEACNKYLLTHPHLK